MPLTKRENFYIKNKADFEEGKISDQKFHILPADRQVEYCKKELSKKYKKSVRFTCINCAYTALYVDNGFVTDEELIEDTGLRRK